jgi:signal transduction histidine kinase/CheY-like chemotaxis protein
MIPGPARLAAALRPTDIPLAAGRFTTAVGATALAGWIFGLDSLKSIAGTITMKANMAVALVAFGVSLVLLVRAEARLKPAAALLAALGGMIGALTLSEHLFGWNLGIDQLLFIEAAGADATMSPGRMGPNGATNLVLASLALLSLRHDTPAAVRRAQALAGVMVMLATIPLAGYAYGARQLYDVARYTGIAFSTATTLLVLGVGILAARPGMGMIGVFSAAGAGGVLARRLLLPAIVLPLALGYFRVLGQNANLYDTGLGTAFFSISIVAVFVLLIWRTAVELNALDAQRERVELERAHLLERERHARAEVEHANRLKDHFLATLSHELRTPLNAILGYARMLRTGGLPPEKRSRAVEVIERNASAQNQLVDDLLDMSRMTTGRVRLEQHSIAVTAPLQEAIESVRPAAEAKGIAFDVNADPDVGNVHGDEGRLRQVFWNLLSNAVKFTAPGGRVSVSVDTVRDMIRITVRDTGIGIAPTFLPHMFEPFRQADSGSTRRYNGLGLGLAICKQLVELHDGSIAAVSDGQDRGATFTVDLPRNRLGAADVPASGIAGAAWPLASPRRPLEGLDVLAVDDERDSLELVRQVLENAGAAVRTASNAGGALAEIERRTPDLLVADIGMPEVDGCELLRQVRTRTAGTGRPLPAVAVTAYARSDDRRRTRSAGFYAHIPKPIDPDILVAALVAAVQQA